MSGAETYPFPLVPHMHTKSFGNLKFSLVIFNYKKTLGRAIQRLSAFLFILFFNFLWAIQLHYTDWGHIFLLINQMDKENKSNTVLNHFNKNFQIYNCPVSLGCRICWLYFCRGVRPPSNEATSWLWVVTCNAWEQDPGGWAVCDTVVKMVT